MNNGPMTEPTQEKGERSITASWLVGEPDAEGWQARSDLTVMHHKGIGYRATLSTLHQQRNAFSTTRTLNLNTKECSVQIYAHAGARFHRPTLTEVYDIALRELRACFEADDRTVMPYFDADSPVFAYSGSPVRR